MKNRMNNGFPTTKEEIEETINELKTLEEKTEKYDAPIITAQQLNQPVQHCHTSGHSNIDDLIGANGDWYLEFRYHRFGDNTLFLLPDFCNDDKEKEKNDQVVLLADGEFEDSWILGNFIRDNPNTPFIIQEYCFDKCIETLKERLDKLIDRSSDLPYEKFQVEMDEFDKFRSAILNISILSNSDKGVLFDASRAGWKKYININK